MSKRWGVVVFLCAWMLNPALLSGCGLVQGFQFGEAEVVAVVDAANHAGPYRYESKGQVYEISFQVTQTQGEDRRKALAPGAPGALVRQAQACGNRTFLRSAAACLDTTEVPVEGTLLVKRVGGAVLVNQAPAQGRLLVTGTRLERAHLELSSGDAMVRILYAHKTRSFEVDGARLPGS